MTASPLCRKLRLKSEETQLGTHSKVLAVGLQGTLPHLPSQGVGRKTSKRFSLSFRHQVRADQEAFRSQTMDPPARKEKSKVKEPAFRVEKAKQKSAQQELKQRQRAEVRLRRGLCMPESDGEGAGRKNNRENFTRAPCLPPGIGPSRGRESIQVPNGEVEAQSHTPS